jgi:hypothetical protein
MAAINALGVATALRFVQRSLLANAPGPFDLFVRQSAGCARAVSRDAEPGPSSATARIPDGARRTLQAEG